MENNSGSNNNALKIILGIAVVLLVGTAFYTFNLKTEADETQKQLTEEKALVLKDLSNMSLQYDAAIGENEAANKKLVEARGRIEGLMDSLKVSDNNVRSLWRYKKQFLALQDEMESLMEENTALKASNSLLATSLDSTKVQLNERIVFNDSLLAQNSELAGIVENAAVLTTTGLKGFGVIVRSSGKLIPTERAGRADKVRVCYTVAKNKLVGAGDKEFFVQVLDPNDNVLGLNEQIQFEESVLNYSLISKFNYESDNLDICEFVEARGKDFEKGRYIVNVFDQNNLVSTSQFELK
ncbi:MAG: chromosome partitioning protein ParA [Bacteroidetes bacterium]|nr:MAG: chromosome partitioning protein ParA [Bacteroidota bacterium]